MMSDLDSREFNSAHQFQSTIVRQRRIGRTYVRDEANRVRRELGLPERTVLTEIAEATEKMKTALTAFGFRL